MPLDVFGKQQYIAQKAPLSDAAIMQGVAYEHENSFVIAALPLPSAVRLGVTGSAILCYWRLCLLTWKRGLASKRNYHLIGKASLTALVGGKAAIANLGRLKV